MPTLLLGETEQLLEAVKAGREEKVRALLTTEDWGELHVQAVDREGKTALHWACQYGYLNILCMLISYTSTRRPHLQCQLIKEPDSISRNNLVPRKQSTTTTLSQQTDCDQSTKDADNNFIEDDDSVRDKGLQVPDNKCLARNRSCSCSERLVADMVNSRDVKGQTPLHLACNYRRADLASFLVTLPYCDINCADKAGNTPLHRAIHADLHNLACLLCEAGADVRASNSQLRTPLHEAISRGSENVIRTLIGRGCDVNAVTSGVSATTPFLTAIFYYKISMRSSQYGKSLDSILRLLIEAGCKLSQGDCQWTPLSASVDIDQSFIASLLLFSGCRFERNHKNCAYSRSLLVEAFTHCETYVVKLLVLCGYQPSLEEVDQCSRRIPSFSPLFYRISHSERLAMKIKVRLLDWLRQRACSTPSLMELSRRSVRLALNHAADDRSILKRIPQLPVPTSLQQYVGLADFTESILL